MSVIISLKNNDDWCTRILHMFKKGHDVVGQKMLFFNYYFKELVLDSKRLFMDSSALYRSLKALFGFLNSFNYFKKLIKATLSQFLLWKQIFLCKKGEMTFFFFPLRSVQIFWMRGKNGTHFCLRGKKDAPTLWSINSITFWNFLGKKLDAHYFKWQISFYIVIL